MHDTGEAQWGGWQGGHGTHSCLHQNRSGGAAGGQAAAVTDLPPGYITQEQPNTTQAGRDLTGDSLMDNGAKLLRKM